MILVSTVIALALAHFVGDFLAQTDEMAQNKSKSWYWLTMHIITYTLWLTTVVTITLKPLMMPLIIFSLVNGAIHFIVDAVTSRITSRLWEQKKVHWFFVVIGFDQFLHLVTLLLTVPLLGG